MKTVEIICTGSELLTNPRIDTNSVYLSQKLQEIGVETKYKSTVGDNREELESVIRGAIGRVDIVILSGGLGPTVDDLTRDVIADITQSPLEYHEDVWEAIYERLTRVLPNRSIPEAVKVQAMVPKNAHYFINQNGTAPGLAVEFNSKLIVALPGPPKELIPMWENQIQPWIIEKYGSARVIRTKILKTYGLPESMLNERILDLFTQATNPQIGVCAAPGMVDVRLLGWGDTADEVDQKMKELEEKLHYRMGNHVYGYDTDTLEKSVGDLLRKKGWKLSVAESCSGGLISHRITNIPGSSDYFDRGIVVYSNNAKEELLGVPAAIIEQYGAVSEETAEKMAAGIQAKTGTEVALAVTGIAGPGGGTQEKPVGLVYISLAKADHSVKVIKYQFPGDREFIKTRTANEALNILRLYLLQV